MTTPQRRFFFFFTSSQLKFPCSSLFINAQRFLHLISTLIAHQHKLNSRCWRIKFQLEKASRPVSRRRHDTFRCSGSLFARKQLERIRRDELSPAHGTNSRKETELQPRTPRPATWLAKAPARNDEQQKRWSQRRQPTNQPTTYEGNWDQTLTRERERGERTCAWAWRRNVGRQCETRFLVFLQWIVCSKRKIPLHTELLDDHQGERSKETRQKSVSAQFLCKWPTPSTCLTSCVSMGTRS